MAVTKSFGQLRLWQLLKNALEDHLWLGPVMILIAGGVAALVVLGWTRTNRIESIAIALLVGGAALTSGAVLGFLFGIPRAVQETRSGDSDGGLLDRMYQANTNLEQISDWLTKIIVGVTLVEIAKVPGKFMNLSAYVALAFGDPPVPASLAAVVLTYFAITGFWGAYLWTRVFLAPEFTWAEIASRESPAFYEGLVEALLYQPPPDGFEQAIRKGEEYVRRIGQDNWRVWRSLACAYGQKYGYLQDLEKEKKPGSRDTTETEKMKEMYTQALVAVTRIEDLNPAEMHGIRNLWLGTTPGEDDLNVFNVPGKYPEFQKLFGKRDKDAPSSELRAAASGPEGEPI